jgi:hypothetical protein
MRSDKGENQLIELLVDLDNKRVIKNEHLDNYRRVGGQFELLNLVLYFRVRQTSGFDQAHIVGSYIDADYMRLVESACLADPKVQDEIKKLKLPANSYPICSIGPWLDNYRRVGGQFELLNLVLYFRVRQTTSRVQVVMRSDKGENQLIELLVDLDNKRVIKNEHLSLACYPGPLEAQSTGFHPYRYA